MSLLISNKISAELSFRSDPEFPCSLENRSALAQNGLLESLFADYSNLGLTYPTDRPVAIDSLARALASALNTNVRYGIFEHFLHRSLLWQPQNIPLRQITYAAGKAPPSWSWMAYHGQIQYLQNLEYGGVEWDSSVRLVKAKAGDEATSPENNSYVLEARVKRLQDCKIKPKGVIYDKEDNEVGYLYFDTQLKNVLPEVRCAIMGRETGAEDRKRKYHVLFVTGRGKFERVGMGSIQQRFILFDGQGDTAQIL